MSERFEEPYDHEMARKVHARLTVPDPDPGFVEHLEKQIQVRAAALQAKRTAQAAGLTILRPLRHLFKVLLQSARGTAQAIGPVVAIVLLVLLMVFAITRLIPGEGVGPAADTQHPIIPPSEAGDGGDASPNGQTQPPERTPASRAETSDNAIFYTVQEGDTLEGIVEQSGVHLEIILALNELSPDDELIPGQRLLLGFQVRTPTPAIPLVPTPVTPAPTQSPLTSISTSEEIRQRLKESRNLWRTLWADSEITTISKNESHTNREQVWISQPDKSRWLHGQLGSDPTIARISVGYQSVSMNLQSGESMEVEVGGLIPSDLRQVLFSEGFAYRGGTFRKINMETVAGREAIVVDWTNNEGRLVDRFWIDVYTGVVLRWQHLVREYPDASGRVTPTEIVITAIAYDVDFPPTIFDTDSLLEARFEEGQMIISD